MRKILRLSAVWIYFLVVSGIGLLITFLRPFNHRNTKMFGDLYRQGLKILGVKLERINWDRIDTNRSCVYISNHQDSLDVFVIGGSVPDRTVSIGKKEIKFIPFFGQVFWLSGNILIDRSNRKRAFKSLEKAKNKMLKRKLSIWIMPEGTRSRGRGLLPFKKGPFFLAKLAGVPIVPIVVSSYDRVLDLNAKDAGTIKVSVMEEINTNHLTDANIGDFAKEVHAKMQAELDRISQ